MPTAVNPFPDPRLPRTALARNRRPPKSVRNPDWVFRGSRAAMSQSQPLATGPSYNHGFPNAPPKAASRNGPLRVTTSHLAGALWAAVTPRRRTQAAATRVGVAVVKPRGSPPPLPIPPASSVLDVLPPGSGSLWRKPCPANALGRLLLRLPAPDPSLTPLDWLPDSRHSRCRCAAL